MPKQKSRGALCACVYVGGGGGQGGCEPRVEVIVTMMCMVAILVM